MYCPNCGKKNNDDNAFCFACGFDLTKDDVKSAPTCEVSDMSKAAQAVPKAAFPKKAVICAAAVCICLAGGALILSGQKNKNVMQDTSDTQSAQELQPALNRDGKTVYTTYSLWGELDFIAREGEYEILSYEGTDKSIDLSKLFGAVDPASGDYAVIIDEEVFAGCSFRKVSADCRVTVDVSAFERCDYLEEVSFTGSTQIEDNAFKDCMALTSVNMENALEIGTSAFENCTELASVNISNAAKIGKNAFRSCSALKSVLAAKAERIENHAFEGCTNLTDIDFPGASYAGASAFEGCKALAAVNMPAVLEIGNAAFTDCKKLAAINMQGVSKIGDNAFKNCIALTEVNIPAASEIGVSAFENCRNLMQMNMPDVKTVNKTAFKDCTKLKTVSMPSAEKICDLAFENCTNLSEAELPEKEIEISTTAFSGSKQEERIAQVLKSVTHTAETPNGEIQFSTDGKAISLKKYTGNDKEISYSIISEALQKSGQASYERIEIGEKCFAGSAVEIAHINGFDKVGTRAFAGCKNLNELWCCGDMGDYAFEGCINLKAASISPTPMDAYDYQSIYSYTASVGKGCFKDSGLESLSIADYDLVDYSISEDAFEGTPIETAVNSPNTAKIYNSTAMRFFPEKFEDCDFELHVSLSGSPFDYDEYIYANIVTDGSGSIGEAIAFEKTPELENISAEATEELDIICIFTGKMASRFEYGYGDVGVPLYTIKEIKNPEAIGGYNDSSYLRLSDFSEDEISAFGFEDKYYDTGFMIDIYVLDTDGGKAGNFIGFDMLSDYNVRTVAYYPGGTDIGKVYRVYGRFRGFYTDEMGYTYLDFETDKYDDVTEEYF